MGYYFFVCSHHQSFLTFDGAKIVCFSDVGKGKIYKAKYDFP